MKSLMTGTEVRISQISSSMCIKEQQQQLAVVACVWSSSLLLAAREQASRGERVTTVHPRLSASVMAIVCHFSEG